MAVYFAVSRSHPELTKVGWTEKPLTERLRELREGFSKKDKRIAPCLGLNDWEMEAEWKEAGKDDETALKAFIDGHGVKWMGGQADGNGESEVFCMDFTTLFDQWLPQSKYANKFHIL